MSAHASQAFSIEHCTDQSVKRMKEAGGTGIIGKVETMSSSSSSSVIMGEGRASLPTSQLYTWIVRWKVIT